MKKSIAEFVKGLDSHLIYDEPKLSQDFETETGHKAVWPKHTVGSTNTSLGKIKGITEEIKGNESDHCSYGYEIAAACEMEFAKSNNWSIFMGRGSSFRAAVAALEKAGK